MIIEDRPMPKIVGRGPIRGKGPNITLLSRLKPKGPPLFDVPFRKMESLRQTAYLMGIKIQVRAIPDLDGHSTHLYAIQRMT